MLYSAFFLSSAMFRWGSQFYICECGLSKQRIKHQWCGKVEWCYAHACHATLHHSLLYFKVGIPRSSLAMVLGTLMGLFMNEEVRQRFSMHGQFHTKCPDQAWISEILASRFLDLAGRCELFWSTWCSELSEHPCCVHDHTTDIEYLLLNVGVSNLLDSSMTRFR